MSARGIESLKTSADKAERRQRASKAIAAGAKALVGALAVAAVALTLRKTNLLGERSARVVLILAALGALIAAAIAYTRKLPRFSGAVALDRYHALSDRLSSALSFWDLPVAERTPFMDAAIADALASIPKVDPRKAVPFKSPRELPIIAGLTIAVALIALFEVRHHIPTTSAKTIDPVDVTADDLDAMRDFLKDMQQNANSDAAKEATQEFNQLIEDLAAKRLDRTEAFRRMQALEDKLLEGRDADAKSLEEAMQKIGEEMKKSELTKPAGEALDNKDLIDAQKQLHDLAKKLRENGTKIDKDQLEKMREALKQASADQAKRQESLAQKRDQLQKDLLQEKQKQPDGGANDQEKSLLEKKERELERLDRDDQQQQAVGRQLDRLDRELDKAAEDLMKDMGLSAQDLDKSAEDINRMAEEKMSDEEKEQLREKLQELRELMRQQGQGGQQQMARLRKFQQHAQGKGGQSGQQGQGQDQDGQEGQEGQDGQQGQNGQGQGQGQNGQQGGQGQQGQSGQGSNQGGQGGQQGGSQAQNGQNGQGAGQQGGGQGQGSTQGGQGGGGQGSGSQKSEVWVIGPGGQKILMLSQGSGSSSGGSGNGGNGSGQSPGSHGYGSGSGGAVEGQATNMKSGTQDTQVAGQDTGQGGSRSEVIQGAAERGFSSRGYTRVYREYHTVAEEALGKDEIPGGYRFYVRRYFELIRPRDDQEPAPKQP